MPCPRPPRTARAPDCAGTAAFAWSPFPFALPPVRAIWRRNRSRNGCPLAAELTRGFPGEEPPAARAFCVETFPKKPGSVNQPVTQSPPSAVKSPACTTSFRLRATSTTDHKGHPLLEPPRSHTAAAVRTVYPPACKRRAAVFGGSAASRDAWSVVLIACKIDTCAAIGCCIRMSAA